MHKSTVIEILKGFSEEDITQFTDFVNSPFFNKNKSVSKMFVEMKKHYPGFETDNLKKENIWKKIYPGKTFNYGVMKNLIYELTKLLEEYLTIQPFRHSIQKNYFLLQGLSQKQILNLSEKKYSYFEKKEKEVFKEHNSYLFYHTYSELYQINLTYKINDKLSTDISEAESKFMAFRFAYCFIMITRDFTDHVVLNTFNKTGQLKNGFSDIYFEIFNNQKVDKVIALLEKDFPNEHKMLIVYRNMFLAYMNAASFEHYIKFKNSVFESADFIPMEEIKLLSYKLKNLIAILRNNNKKNLNAESLEIYNFMVEREMHVRSNGTVPELEFNNYVSYLCEFNKAGKLEDFISKFANKVTPANKVNSYNYGMASLSFLKGNFNQSLNYILKLNNDYERLKISIRTLQVKCYYELNDYESFISLHNSFKKFDHKNVFGMELHQKTLLDICGLVNKLFKLKNSYDGAGLKLMKDEIDKKELPDSIWLNEKITEIAWANKKNKKLS